MPHTNDPHESPDAMNSSPHAQAKGRNAAKAGVAAKRRAGPRPVKADRAPLPAPLRAIGNEHRYISRLLLILEDEAEALRSSGRCDYETLHRVMDYLSRFPDRYHHPKEDLIFDRMSDPAHTEVIAELRQSHKDIAQVNRKLLDAISDQLCVPKRARARSIADWGGRIAPVASSGADLRQGIRRSTCPRAATPADRGGHTPGKRLPDRGGGPRKWRVRRSSPRLPATKHMNSETWVAVGAPVSSPATSHNGGT